MVNYTIKKGFFFVHKICAFLRICIWFIEEMSWFSLPYFIANVISYTLYTNVDFIYFDMKFNRQIQQHFKIFMYNVCTTWTFINSRYYWFHWIQWVKWSLKTLQDNCKHEWRYFWLMIKIFCEYSRKNLQISLKFEYHTKFEPRIMKIFEICMRMCLQEISPPKNLTNG